MITPNLPYYGALVSGDLARARYIAAGMGGDHLAAVESFSGQTGTGDQAADDKTRATERASQFPNVQFVEPTEGGE